MRKIMIVTLLVLMLTLAGTTAATGTASAYVVHGIPGLTVDIYVNGSLFVAGFTPGTIAGPIELPSAPTDLAIVPAGGDPANPALAATITLEAGKNFSLVAHLTESGAPTLSVLENDLSSTKGTRLIVRHLAAAPVVDLKLGTNPSNLFYTIPNIANGNEGVLNGPATNACGGIAPAGSASLVYGPFCNYLRGGTVYIGYAVGSLADGTFTVLSQSINVWNN